MEPAALQARLADLKAKHETVEKAWRKRDGNMELLQFFVAIMPKALDAERCSIFILDPQSEKVWVQCGTGLAEKTVEVPTSGSLVGRTVSTGKPIIEHDMENHVGPHDHIAVRTGFVTRNALCVPVHGLSTKRVTGAIQILNKRGSMKFGPADITTVEKLAFLLQMNIENIYLRQELSRLLAEMEKQMHILEAQLAQTGNKN